MAMHRSRTRTEHEGQGNWQLTIGLALVTLFGVATTNGVAAGPFDAATSAASNYTKTRHQPRRDCRALRAVTTVEFSVVDAEALPGGCRVELLIPLEIRAEVWLPDKWNGRLFMHGNGGLAGTPPEDPQRRALSQRALDHGFVTAYTDTGHDRRVETGGTFAHNGLHKLVDWGYRAVHLTADAAKKVSDRYYGRAPRHSYFLGCSTGGRQALMSAQRFPDDFDGIIAGAPANDYSGLKFSQAWRMQALKEQPLDAEEVANLAAHIYARCDAGDGLADGLLDDPRSCDFDPARDLPRCAEADGVDCFSDEELAALERYYAPVTLGSEVVYPAFPVGSEVVGPQGVTGWVPWLLNPGGRALLDLLGSDFFRYMAFVEDNPDYDWIDFDFSAAPDNLSAFRRIVDAVDADLTPFKRRGGKLISYFGWADPDINPLSAINYHERVASTTGEVDAFYKLYMVPGMFHCRGGPGPDVFDALSPLIDWVELGREPSAIPARHVGEDGQTVYERPLCPYPERVVASESPSAAPLLRCE